MKDHKRELGRTGLSCHPLGFGCYRIGQGNKEHEASLRAYMDRGGNLIDTSANYTDGMSESLVGHVLKDYRRDDVILVTKGGYIQGQNMALAQQRTFPEVVHYGEGIWHCIHPEFLETQIEGSLARLQAEKIDVYLLHNPEYFLTDREHHGGARQQDHEEFYRRIGSAFGFLENQVQSGKIGWYGISSNNFGLTTADSAMTSIEKCLERANGITGGHHFGLIQLPMNLYEPGGALEENNGGMTALEYCRTEGLGVLANRPLNAFTQNRLIRLADFLKPGQPQPDEEALRKILNPLRKLEQRLAAELNVPLMGDGLGVAGLLENFVPPMKSVSQWEQAAGYYMINPLKSWLKDCDEIHGSDERWRIWLEEFLRTVNPIFGEVAEWISAKDQSTSNDVRAQLSKAGYPDVDRSLSRMAMHVLASLPGLGCVLNGMRTPEYVEDAMGVADLAPLDGLGIMRKFSR